MLIELTWRVGKSVKMQQEPCILVSHAEDKCKTDEATLAPALEEERVGRDEDKR